MPEDRGRILGAGMKSVAISVWVRSHSYGRDVLWMARRRPFSVWSDVRAVGLVYAQTGEGSNLPNHGHEY